MKHFKKLTIALLALLSFSATAWAQTEELLVTINSSENTAFKSGSKTFDDIATVTFSGAVNTNINYYGWYQGDYEVTLSVSASEGYTITKVKFFCNEGSDEDTTAPFEALLMYEGGDTEDYVTKVNGNIIGRYGVTKIEVYGYQNAVGPEVTLNSDKTIATMTMPESDVTVSYDLVRDIQDETYPVAFGGITPTADGTSTKLIVKKGDDGKYQFAEALNITLDDPLISGDNKNIIAADGITVKVLVGDDSNGPIEYDDANPITLEAFLANPAPGFYWIKAEATDDGAYEGTVYSPELWLIEKYDLAIQPADDFSKGKVDAVTVGGQPVTLDADGKATTTADPAQEVKLKAKRGYVIEKVEAAKKTTALAPALENGATVVIAYTHGTYDVATFTFTNNGGTYTSNGSISSGMYTLDGSLTQNGSTLSLLIQAQDIDGDPAKLAIDFDTTKDTFRFVNKGSMYRSHTVSVNGTDITSKLTELK